MIRHAISMAVCALGLALPANALASGLPKGFVYLRDIDPSIIQEIRYFGIHNFVGRRIRGYLAPECILSRKAAVALVKVQKRLRERQLSLKVYDCYRPDRAVKDFSRWARKRGDTRTKAEFYPLIPKAQLFRRGYISKRSRHSVGSAVDLTIVPLPAPDQPKYDPLDEQAACHLPQGRRFPDNSLDFGTGFDCFHTRSHTANRSVSRIAQLNRSLLVDEMSRVGFKNYRKEWWHFELRNPPFGGRRFDFPIRPRPVKKKPKTETAETDSNSKAGLRKAIADSGKKKPGKKPVSEAASSVGPPAKAKKPKRETYKGRYRIICATDRAPVLLRSRARKGSKIVYRVYGETTDVRVRGCRGKHGLMAWRSLDAIGRQIEKPPWCRVVMPGDGASGWVYGRYLLRQGAPKKDACLP